MRRRECIMFTRRGFGITWSNPHLAWLILLGLVRDIRLGPK